MIEILTSLCMLAIPPDATLLEVKPHSAMAEKTRIQCRYKAAAGHYESSVLPVAYDEKGLHFYKPQEVRAVYWRAGQPQESVLKLEVPDPVQRARALGVVYPGLGADYAQKIISEDVTQ